MSSEGSNSRIKESFIAAKTIILDNEEKEHIIIALHEYINDSGDDKNFTYMVDISKSDMMLEMIDCQNDEKFAFKTFHNKQMEYFKKVVTI